MPIAQLNGIHLNYRLDGPKDGTQVVLANSLGTDLRLWDHVLPLLPAGLRILCYDKRGHGLSDCPNAPYTMGQLVGDAEALMEHVGFRDAIFVGLSIGGLIAQGLATKRLDLLRAIVLSNTGAKIGTRQMWQDRIDAVQTNGPGAIVDLTMERWFSRKFRDSAEFSMWRNMFLSCRAEGWVGCAHAIAGTDFYTPTAALRLPALGIAGSEDGSTPPDMVRETIDLIPGSDFQLIRGAGHLPCVKAPQTYAALLSDFLKAQGHS